MAPRLKLYLHCGYRSLVLVVLVRVRGEEGRKGRVKWRRKRVRKKAGNQSKETSDAAEPAWEETRVVLVHSDIQLLSLDDA